jgi:queuine tRNA-ribosyltransferase
MILQGVHTQGSQGSKLGLETMFAYELTHASRRAGSRARVGRLITPHGTITTPAFVAVGTHAAVKALTANQAQDTGQAMLFCNVYHLLLHPGPDTIASFGGLHKYMGMVSHFSP